MGGHRDRSLLAAKRALRQRMRAVRDGIAPAAAQRASERVAALVTDLVARRSATQVALYAAMGSELPTATIDRALRAAGVAVCYPRVDPARGELHHHAVARLEALVPAHYAIPSPDAAWPVVALNDIDVFLLPGLAFDRRGGRLGWGQGYYDRALAKAPAGYRCGVGLEAQLVEIVPCDERDAALDCVITEAGVVPTGARSLG